MLVHIIKETWNGYKRGCNIYVATELANILLHERIAYEAYAFDQLSGEEQAAIYANAATDPSTMEERENAFKAELEAQQSELDDHESRITALEGE